MDMMDVIRSRHSVRRFKDEPLESGAVSLLKSEIDACNEESGLHIQLITGEPEAFQAGKTGYGQFKGCRNYLVVAGPRGRDEDAGYYGERVVLKAQELGINSCWVALTYKKSKAQGETSEGEKRYLVIALGYGETSGSPPNIWSSLWATARPPALPTGPRAFPPSAIIRPAIRSGTGTASKPRSSRLPR